jgi:protein gp37
MGVGVEVEMNNIKKTIGWADYSWNPITGCSPASEGCDHCYAEAINKRFGLPWGTPVFKPERIEEPLKLKRASRIFVCSMSDLFHEDAPIDAQSAVWDVAKCCPQHTFIILTKRAMRMKEILIETGCFGLGELPNIWLGVSAENQARANERIPELLRISAAKRVVSVEPMLGCVDLSRQDRPFYAGKPCWPCNEPLISMIDWVIAGPETGAGKRPCKDVWINDLADQCKQANVPFYDKRNQHTRREWPG